MKNVIINTDGYGFTEGISRAIEECVAFGTVRSLSANVNFPCVASLKHLVEQYPFLSVGCHLNPVVGRPILPPEEVHSLIDVNGEFFYKSFLKRLSAGLIREEHLRAELLAQVRRTRDLAGDNFTHVDFHMGIENQPRIYPLYLEIASESGVGRIRTHKYHFGYESSRSSLRHLAYLASSPLRPAKYLYNLLLRQKALARGFAMPDATISGTSMVYPPGRISVENFINLLGRLPEGYLELVFHPAYLDDDLLRWSTYIQPREREREVLMSPRFRDAFAAHRVRLAGYRDIPLRCNYSLPQNGQVKGNC